MLNVLLLLHTVVALAVAFAFLLFYEPFTVYLTGITKSQFSASPIKGVIIAYAWLTAVGLITVAAVADFARRSGHSSVRWGAIFALLVNCIAFIAASLFISFALKIFPLATLVFLIALIFLLLYLWIIFFYRDTV
jgi:hypothetical protein